MKKPTEVLNIFRDYTKEVDLELKNLMSEQNDLKMFDMMSYFFGFKDENLCDNEIFAGKRFRSGLTLLLADFYCSKAKAVEVATAIEVFHNFTLIHDDIEDNDPLRRGRPTVWKLWGLNHGINTGDGQLILANLELLKACNKHNLSLDVQTFLNKTFLDVIEGQFLDFTLTDLSLTDSFVTEENYLTMIMKKSSVLIGAATKVAGMVANCDKEELDRLWEYGLNLGFAYQICDDLVSIWGKPELTGKIAANDIKEKKKTLPIIYLFNILKNEEKQEFLTLYNKTENLNDSEIERVIELLEFVDAYEYTWQKLNYHCQKSLEAVQRLSISDEAKQKLRDINAALLPNVKEVCKC